MLPVRSNLENLKLDKALVANIFKDLITEGWFADIPGRRFNGAVLNRPMMPTCGAACRQIDLEQEGPENLRQKLETLLQMEHNGVLNQKNKANILKVCVDAMA